MDQIACYRQAYQQQGNRIVVDASERSQRWDLVFAFSEKVPTASHLVQDAVDVVVDGDRRSAVTDWRKCECYRWYSRKDRKQVKRLSVGGEVTLLVLATTSKLNAECAFNECLPVAVVKRRSKDESNRD